MVIGKYGTTNYPLTESLTDLPRGLMIIKGREPTKNRLTDSLVNSGVNLASRLRQTANVRLKFPVYQKLVKFIWFQLIFCLLATAMEQVLKTEK